jgi:hypothetical protein
MFNRVTASELHSGFFLSPGVISKSGLRIRANVPIRCFREALLKGRIYLARPTPRIPIHLQDQGFMNGASLSPITFTVFHSIPSKYGLQLQLT